MTDWHPSRTFDSPEGTIRWDSFGAGSPIVLLHGTPNWSVIWRDVVERLATRHEVYVFDWPGFGRSARFAGQNISWDEQARRLPELFTHWELAAPTVVAFDFAPVFALRAHFFAGLPMGRASSPTRPSFPRSSPTSPGSLGRTSRPCASCRRTSRKR